MNVSRVDDSTAKVRLARALGVMHEALDDVAAVGRKIGLDVANVELARSAIERARSDFDGPPVGRA